MNIWNPKIYYVCHLEPNRKFKMSINVLFIDPLDGADYDAPYRLVG